MKGEKNNVCTCAYRRNNVKLSRICGNRLYMDPQPDHGADHVHPRESVPCGWFGSLYVWCCDLVLHSHQKCLRGFLALFCILFFAFPAYAEDEDLVYSDYVYTYSGSNSSGSFTATLNVYADSIVLSSLEYDSEATFSYVRLLIPVGTPTTSEYVYQFSSVGQRISLDDGVNDYSSSRMRVYGRLNDTTVAIEGDSSVFPPIPSGAQSYDFMEYLTNTGSVFTWLLSTITALITWIFGNAFLAVLFCLFVAGTVISFFVRVRQ